MNRLAPHHRHRGFTLIELMVVVVIISVMLTLVTWNIGDGGRQQRMEDEVRRLAALMRLARDEAILMSQELAMVIDDEGYGFQILGEKGFELIEDDRVLRERTLEEGLELELELETFTFLPTPPKEENEGVGEEGSESEAKQEDENLLRIFFLSSGEVSPFKLYIREQDNLDSQRYLVSVDLQGDIKWEGPLSPDEF